MSKDPDWSKTGTVVAMAEWLRSKSDAIAVLVVRPNDGALAVDPRCAPADAGEKLAEQMPALLMDLAAARREGRKAARVEMEAMSE